jgi:hypothetical protein
MGNAEQIMKRRTTPRPKALWVQIRNAGKPAPAKKLFIDWSSKRHVKQRKRVRQVSAAQRVKWDEYAGAKALFLMGRTRCERCNCVAVLELHHKRGRVGALLTDHRYFAALCRRCHRWVHENPAEARAAGWLEQWGKAEA